MELKSNMRFFKELSNTKDGLDRYHFRVFKTELETLYAILVRLRMFTPKTKENSHYYGMVKNMTGKIGQCLNKDKGPFGEMSSAEALDAYQKLGTEITKDFSADIREELVSELREKQGDVDRLKNSLQNTEQERK